jgi:hypothetical protein
LWIFIFAGREVVKNIKAFSQISPEFILKNPSKTPAKPTNKYIILEFKKYSNSNQKIRKGLKKVVA